VWEHVSLVSLKTKNGQQVVAKRWKFF